MRRFLKIICLSAVLLAGVVTSADLQACPMCKVAQEDAEDPAVAARPKAYMYSILFMLSMPATLFTLFSVSFYRLSKRQQAANEALLGDAFAEEGRI